MRTRAWPRQVWAGWEGFLPRPGGGGLDVTPPKPPIHRERNVVPPSRRFHDRADRVHNALWLIDCDDMTGLRGNDLAPALRKPDLVALQLSPCLVGAPRARHDHHRNRQRTSSAPDFRRALQ